MSTPTKESGHPSLTQRDFNLLLAAFESNKNDFSVDYAEFAEKTGLANANSGKASWHRLKEKLDKLGGGIKDGGAASPATGEDGTTKATPANGKKRKGAAAEGEDGGEVKTPASKKGKKSGGGDGDAKTPAPKKGKKGKKETSPVVESIEKIEEDGEGVEGVVKAESED